MKKWNALLLALILSSGFLALPSRGAEEAPAAASTETVAEAPTVKQLRGKLLYKRNQIRKLERAAAEQDRQLETKVTELENQIQALYVAADPKLEQLYQAEQELLIQIEQATPKK